MDTSASPIEFIKKKAAAAGTFANPKEKAKQPGLGAAGYYCGYRNCCFSVFAFSVAGGVMAILLALLFFWRLFQWMSITTTPSAIRKNY